MTLLLPLDIPEDLALALSVDYKKIKKNKNRKRKIIKEGNDIILLSYGARLSEVKKCSRNII